MDAQPASWPALPFTLERPIPSLCRARRPATAQLHFHAEACPLPLSCSPSGAAPKQFGPSNEPAATRSLSLSLQCRPISLSASPAPLPSLSDESAPQVSHVSYVVGEPDSSADGTRSDSVGFGVIPKTRRPIRGPRPSARPRFRSSRRLLPLAAAARTRFEYHRRA